LISEPILDALDDNNTHFTIYTDHKNAAKLIDKYDRIEPYDDHHKIAPNDFNRVIKLKYEVYPEMNHLDGYALYANVKLNHRVPLIQKNHTKLGLTPYGLIAPDVSSWIKNMRQWSSRNFQELSKVLEVNLNTKVIFLEPEHSFSEMLSLIEHCDFFIGNDSGPAILAQCFQKQTFVLFGATNPKFILLDKRATPISNEIGCNGCKHTARHTNIQCATPMCLSSLTVDFVSEVVKSVLQAKF